MTSSGFDFSRFKAMTFDIVGTLIDFEQGLLDWLQPRFAAAGCDLSDRQILESFAAREDCLHREHPELDFTAMLPLIYRGLARDYGLANADGETEGFARDAGQWPAFADSRDALFALRERFTLCALTNAGSRTAQDMAVTLGNPFHFVISAEEVGISKPSHRNFAYAQGVLSTKGIKREEILHVAQSQFHDLRPARELGIPVVWVKRRHDQEGFGGSPVPDNAVEPDLLVRSMAELAELAAV